ncbi:uncharacterized protein LOC123393914, partial [Mustela putorius furo]|uniref:Uncharacterized protein LOC123393914 n=1 Tax=Mustela putorius furo TaxID=9669 RepID=A0A8U0SK52_MUSPF
MINPEGTIVYIHSVKSIMSKLNIYRSHTWTPLPPRLRAEKEHIPGRVPGWQEKWAWSLGQPSEMGGASRLRGRGLLGSIQSVWPLSLQCRWKCSTSRSVTAVISLVHVHRSEPKLMINPEGTIVYIHSVKSIMSKLNIYRSHTWTSLPPRLRAEKEHIPGRVPGWQEKWAWSLGQPSEMGGASRLRGRGLLGSIQSVWPLSLQCRWKCSTSRSVTAVISLVHVHRSEPKLMINPEGTIVYIHSVKSIMSKLNIYRSHTWTSLPPRLRAEKEHIP